MHEEPTEGIWVSILGEVLGYVLAAAARSVGPMEWIPDKGLLSDIFLQWIPVDLRRRHCFVAHK